MTCTRTQPKYTVKNNKNNTKTTSAQPTSAPKVICFKRLFLRYYLYDRNLT